MKTRSFFIILILLLCMSSPNVSAQTNKKYETQNYSYSPAPNNQEFRGVWITPVTNDVQPFSSEYSFKREMEEIFTVMEHFKLNAMVFHVRTHNNAYYKSELNPIAKRWQSVNFDEFDPLEWLIAESHKRGIEFHAWMNPYRLGNSHYYGEVVPSVNPASNRANTASGILNPGLPHVREFLIDTVMEFIEQYDVDAIHFDDYFYVNGIDDAETRRKYNPKNLGVADWRREQVNMFIEGLSTTMRNYNKTNNRYVQLGISPTGIYKNGNGRVSYDNNGKPITNGSATGGQQHYASYLYADTLKWISEGWLDYILPQSYWATNHNVASYYKVMDWWNKVVKHLDVNLYSGIGVYQANEEGRFGWRDDTEELAKQLNYAERLENVSGVCFFTYNHLRTAYRGSTNMSSKQLANIGTKVWFEKKLLPEIKSMKLPKLGQVSNLTIAGNKLRWDKLPDARYYVIYRSQTGVNFENVEIIDVIGSNENRVVYLDTEYDGFYYGVKAVGYDNVLGEGATATRVEPDPVYNLYFYVDDELLTTYTTEDVFKLPDIPPKRGYTIIGPVWSITDFTNITEDTRIDAIYTINEYKVTFITHDNKVISSEYVKHGYSVNPPTPPTVEGYEFIGWNLPLDDITMEQNIKALYKELPEEPDDPIEPEEPIDPEEPIEPVEPIEPEEPDHNDSNDWLAGCSNWFSALSSLAVIGLLGGFSRRKRKNNK